MPGRGNARAAFVTPQPFSFSLSSLSHLCLVFTLVLVQNPMREHIHYVADECGFILYDKLVVAARPRAARVPSTPLVRTSSSNTSRWRCYQSKRSHKKRARVLYPEQGPAAERRFQLL